VKNPWLIIQVRIHHGGTRINTEKEINLLRLRRWERINDKGERKKVKGKTRAD
jgi:hypothetical protein